MIDEIVQMILKEARARKGLSLKTRVSNVMIEVVRRIGLIMQNHEHEERREKEDENKG